MEKSILIKRLIECKDAQDENIERLLKAYQFSTAANDNLDPSELFTKCVSFINDLSDLDSEKSLLLNFNRQNQIAEKLSITNSEGQRDVHRTDIYVLINGICECLGDTIKRLCITPVFTKPSHLEGCPISTDELVMYTAKPFDVTEQPIVTFEGDRYRATNRFEENAGYYHIYLVTLELI